MNKLHPILPAAILVAACSGSQALVAPNVPPALRPAANQPLFHEALAVGVQVYECRADERAPEGHAWSFVAPEATLTNRQGTPVGRHYGGPTWEAQDGSLVVGEVKARAPAPLGDSIPWLLLGAKSAQGRGVFSATASILRVDTVGGNAPADGCGPESIGRKARVPYRATYYFFGNAAAA